MCKTIVSPSFHWKRTVVPSANATPIKKNTYLVTASFIVLLGDTRLCLCGTQLSWESQFPQLNHS